ncbi:MAG: cobalt transporter CbiM [Fimbriimonas sp.]|nr:cobalt transporter CbiM [Fimbriimonas sp.]
MHIPDAYLSPATEAVAFVVMAPIWMVAVRKTSHSLSSRQTPLLSVGAAFCFAVQMFNIPAIGGTSAHALGATLLAILVGPWAALMGISLELAIQALLFGDGGILSLGANCFDMGFVAVFVGYGLYRLLVGSRSGSGMRSIVAAGVAAYVGTVSASFSAGLLLGIQPAIAHDQAGHALYCPFGLSVAIPAMVITHMLVAGPAEAIITVAALAYLRRTYPELIADHAKPHLGTGLRLARGLAWVLVLTPLGLIANGSAWGEWELTELRRMVGYAPAGIMQAKPIIRPLLPDYGFAGSTGGFLVGLGYLVSAFIGCALVAGFTRTLLHRRTVEPMEQSSPGAPGGSLPDWMVLPNPPCTVSSSHGGPWLERALLRMREKVASSIASETVARQAGLLQSVQPTAKTVGFLILLLSVAVSRSFLVLVLLALAILVSSAASRVPIADFVQRVGATTAFFGLIVAVPVAFQTVSPGSTIWSVFGITVSVGGVHSAALILLRLACGIGLAILWNLTTPWRRLIRSFHSLGVPNLVLTTATLTYRYLFVTVETLADMVEARTSRQAGGLSKREARLYAGTGSAVLFSKSLAFSEELHLAMQSRSFDSFPKSEPSRRLSGVDFVFLLAAIAALAISYGVSGHVA